MKRDFIFGMNLHQKGYQAYPHDTLERNLQFCEDMNINLIRINKTPLNPEDLAYVKEVAAAVHARGMKIMLCCDWGGVCEARNTPEEYYEGFKYVAENLKGEIDFYQIFNELDVPAMHTDIGEIYNHGDGKVPEEYDPKRLAYTAPAVKAAIKGMKDGDPDCKTVVNYCWWHTYYIDYLVENGCEWDITGLDWYSDAESKSSSLDVFEWLKGKFGDKPVIICETNWWAYLESDKSEEERQELQKQFVCEYTEHLYKNAPENFMGLIFYELMDEPAFEKNRGSFHAESHFGFVSCDCNGRDAKPKTVCKALGETIERITAE